VLRLFLVGVILTAVGLAAAGPAGADVTTANTATSAATLDRFLCQAALEPAQREISVQAVMRPVTGTQRMVMRVELLQRTKSGGPVTEVSGGDLGAWRTPSNPTLGQRPKDIWNVEHPVIGLSAPASYRFRVTFRWTGSHGKVLAKVQRYSRWCAQPELRPDLLVQSITIEPIPNQPAADRYIAVIRNQGASAAGPFEVLFTPSGPSSVQVHTITLLPAHARRQVTFIGPACAVAGAPTISVDPGDQVADLNRSNNSLTATCPAS
jgi:hypothetical protein